MAIASLFMLTACGGMAQTNNWDARIGESSLEDATRELGPPESCSGLDDGGTVCAWTTLKTKDRIEKLVLTFSPQGRLATATQVRL